MSWEPIIAAAVGGTIGIVGTLAATVLTTRQADRTRWDDEQATAVITVIDVAARLEGWHYRRGRSKQKGESSAMQLVRAERCEDGPPPRGRRRGIAGRTSAWLSARDEHRAAIRALGAQAGHVLGTVKKTRAAI